MGTPITIQSNVTDKLTMNELANAFWYITLSKNFVNPCSENVPAINLFPAGMKALINVIAMGYIRKIAMKVRGIANTK
jgi:hypothetical protein